MTASTLDNDTIGFVCNLVRDRSAIELDANKAYLIDARLAPVAKHLGYSSIAELIVSAKQKPQPKVVSSIVEAMTTNETSFFRDIHPFEALQKHILPDLFAARASMRTLNIWSAACSTGQEIYSIAMLIREHFPQNTTWKFNLLGTDLSDNVLQKATEAKYSQIEINRGLPAALLIKHFEREGIHWKLKPEVRSMATFRKLNLIERWVDIPAMDLIFLRNVLIYFSPDTKRQILEKIRAVMAPDAFLFLGAAETTMNLDQSFERTQIGNCVVYRLKK
jgi:chemotaxis protein methyltransferase CheR